MMKAFNVLRQTLALMVGQPPYEIYLEHMASHHPEAKPMKRVEFFRNREAARYGGGLGKCC